MEIFQLSIDLIRREKKRFLFDKTVYPSFFLNQSSKFSADFNIPHNRCAYMYIYATSNFCFLRDCIKKFLKEYPKAKDLLGSWGAHSLSSICSLSCGPGFDYLALISASSEIESLPPKNLVIISKHRAWENTISLLSESRRTPESLQSVKVVEGDIFGGFTEEMISSLQNSEVVLMFETINLEPGCIRKSLFRSALKEFVATLKPETTIFFIDTKPSATLMLKILEKFPGTLLNVPYYYSHDTDVCFPRTAFKKFGVLPQSNAQGAFFVWQKSAPAVTFIPKHIRSSSKPCKATELPISSSSNLSSKTFESSSFVQLSSVKRGSNASTTPEECFCQKYLSSDSFNESSDALIMEIAPCQFCPPTADEGSDAKSPVSGSREADPMSDQGLNDQTESAGANALPHENNSLKCASGCCSAKGCCSRPVQIQCCHSQLSHSSLSPLYLNGAASIVIPIRNMNVLSEIISKVKTDNTSL